MRYTCRFSSSEGEPRKESKIYSYAPLSSYAPKALISMKTKRFLHSRPDCGKYTYCEQGAWMGAPRPSFLGLIDTSMHVMMNNMAKRSAGHLYVILNSCETTRRRNKLLPLPPPPPHHLHKNSTARLCSHEFFRLERDACVGQWSND